MKTGAFFALGRRRGGAFWGACLVVAMALAICAVLSGCSSQSAKAAKPTTPPAIPVGVGTVKQGDFNEYIVGLGSVQALNTVSIKTRIDGQIMQVNFREGQDVKRGRVTARYRSAAVPGRVGSGKSQSGEGRGPTRQRQGAIRTQQGSVRAGRDRQAGPGHAGSVVRHL